MSVEIPVSPANLDTQFYKFSVSTKASKDDIVFHVTITSRQSDIYPDSDAYVGSVIHNFYERRLQEFAKP